jgi:hypothetical protein
MRLQGVGAALQDNGAGTKHLHDFGDDGLVAAVQDEKILRGLGL